MKNKLTQFAARSRVLLQRLVRHLWFIVSERERMHEQHAREIDRLRIEAKSEAANAEMYREAYNGLRAETEMRQRRCEAMREHLRQRKGRGFATVAFRKTSW